VNIDGRAKTVIAPHLYCIHPSSYRNLAVGEKWRQCNIRVWSKQLIRKDQMGVLRSTQKQVNCF